MIAVYKEIQDNIRKRKRMYEHRKEE